MIPLLIALLLACSTPEHPQTPPVSPPLELREPAIAGGYNTAEITDDIKAIATYAVSQLGLTNATLASVDKAEQQVVAGMNFRLDLTLSDGSRWHVVVFRSLDQQLSLTSKEALPGK